MLATLSSLVFMIGHIPILLQLSARIPLPLCASLRPDGEHHVKAPSKGPWKQSMHRRSGLGHSRVSIHTVTEKARGHRKQRKAYTWHQLTDDVAAVVGEIL